VARPVFRLFGMIGIRGLDNVREGLGSVDQRARRLQRTLTRTSRTLTRIGSNLTKNLTVPLIAAGGAALKFGADFENAMTKSLAIMDNVNDETRKKMEETALQVSETTTASATQAAEAYFFLASAGLNAAQSLQALPKVAKFAQAGNFDLALATDLLTDAQSALGLSSKNTGKAMLGMARVSDVLVKANTLANATVEQFSESLTNKAGAALRMVGKEVEEGVAVLSAFANQGKKGMEAGEALNIVLRDLQTANIKNKKAFKEAGIAVFDGAGEMRNMADIILDLENRLSGMSDEQKRTELGLLGFQDRSISATAALLGTSEAIRNYEKELKSAGGTTDRVAKKQLESLSAQTTIIRNRLQNVAIAVSESLIPIIKEHLLPVIEKWVGAIKRLVDWFNSLPKEVKTLTIAIGSFLVVLGPTTMFFGKLVAIFKTLVPALVLARKGMILLSAAMAANPVGAVIVLILGLVTVMGLLKDENGELKKSFQDTWSGIASLLDDTIAEMRVSLFEFVRDALRYVGEMGSFIPGFGAKIKKARRNLRSMISEERTAIRQKRIYAKEVELQSKANDALSNSIDAATKALSSLIDKQKEKTNLVIADIEATENDGDAAKELYDKKIALEDQWNDKVLRSIFTRKQLLEFEYEEALLNADKFGADKNDIELYYTIERMKMAQEEVDKKSALDKKAKSDRIKNIKDVADFTAQSIAEIASLFSQSYGMQIERVEAKKQAEIDAINNSVMNEEDKAKAINNIEEGSAKKIKELKRKQAIAEKAQAIFSIIMSTSRAIMQALAQLGPIAGGIAAGVIGGIGIAQTAIVSSKPIPLAKGGLVKRTAGGVNTIIGEGKEDEMVLPLKTGVLQLADSLYSKFRDMSQNGLGVPELAGFGGRAVENHWHIGTLVADDNGMKELERRQRKFRVEEDQRRGHER